ncbi:MAG: hypothetical protein IRY85_09900 [Micromonosporaceae bacterium]|nr:hypothetical protein [Micromonosporaceae bacterium]
MLPASLFTPLDLHTAIEAARRTQGAHGVVDLLVSTLTDRRVRSDVDIEQHLDTLKAACRATRRWAEMIPVLERIAALNPQRRHEVAAEVALVHVQLGQHAKALSLLESALAQQRRLPAWRRSLAFSVVAEVVAQLLHAPVLAQECAALAESTATARPARAHRVTAPRRRTGLARPVLVTETEGAVAGPVRPKSRARLMLLQGSAA